MGLFSRSKVNVTEHTLVIRVEPRQGPSGTATGMDSIAALEERLVAAISTARVGEFDGNEFSGSDVFFYAYGPDGDKLLAAVAPILASFPASCRALLRYGEYHDESAPCHIVDY